MNNIFYLKLLLVSFLDPIIAVSFLKPLRNIYFKIDHIIEKSIWNILLYCINRFIVEVFLELFGADILELNTAVQKKELIKLLPICVPNQFELLRKISEKVCNDLLRPTVSSFSDEGIK